ncbi:MAG: O-methyltransferase [Candidatus Bathyarchaeia archaeon]|jgi:predicted O-methyltransferase YrrM
MTQQALTSDEVVLREIEAEAEKQYLPIIGPAKGKYLAEEVCKTRPMRVLEVGTLIGYSTILMGREMVEGSEIISIEIHSDEAELAMQNIMRADIPAKVRVQTGNALDIILTLQGPFDFAFIDAEKTEYFRYLKLMEPMLHGGTVVFADNAGMFREQMRDYLNYVRGSGNYRSRYIQVEDDGVEISVKL